MRFVANAFFAVLLLAAPVTAEPPLQLGLRGTYSTLLHLQSPDIGEAFNAFVPAGLELGYWFDEALYAGVFFEYTFARPACPKLDLPDCSGHSVGGGVDARYAWRAHARVRPWFGVTLGFDRLREFGDNVVPGVFPNPGLGRFVFDYDEVRTGVAGGIDFYVTPRLVVGPYLAERFVHTFGGISNGGEWFLSEVGLRAAFRFDSCGGTPCPTATPPSRSPGTAIETSARIASERAEPIIDRPLVLSKGISEVELRGDFTHIAGGSASAAYGFAGSAGIEVGLGKAQLGLDLGVPIEGFTFGSIYGSAAVAVQPQMAMRIDLGYDREVHDDGESSIQAAGLVTVGIGLPFEVRLARNISFVSGRVGAMSFAHFVNFKQNSQFFYLGAGAVPFASSDLFAVTHFLDGATQLSLHLPLGILVQVADPFAISFRTGYQALILADNGANAHFVPIEGDATLSPTRNLDIGLSLLLPGFVAGSERIFGGRYTDTRIGSLWLRLRI